MGSIVTNVALLYVANHVLEWPIGWITPDWSDVLWAVNLTLWVCILANALFLAFDAGWFRNLAGAVSCAVAALATWWLFVIFPVDFGAPRRERSGRFVLLLMLAGTAAAGLVMIVLAVADFARAIMRPRAAH